MKPVIIIAIAFVLLIPTTAFAADGYFLNDYGKQVSQNPNVCIFQPDDSRIDKQRWNNWYSDARMGINTWKTMLYQSGSGNWNITPVDVPLDKLDLLNMSACDITVEFVEKPFIENGYYANALGWWNIGTGTIKIVYSAFEFCGKIYNSDFDIIVDSYCFSDKLERSKQMGNTVQHEFGHALGLGHYRGYDSSFTQSWYDTGIGAPSIMAFIQPNEDVRQVTQIDTERINQIYGKQGFEKRKTFTPIFNERIILEPVIEVTDGGQIYLYDGEKTTFTISGNIPDKLFKRGVYLEIIIQKPDGTTEYKGISVSKTRHAYNYPLVFDYSSQRGQYEIALQFDGKIFSKEEIHVTKGQKIINNDSDGDGFLDKNDLCPNEYGSSKYGQGCPSYVPPPRDSDGDGFPDDVDGCPIFYSLTNNGCPDTTQRIIEEIPIPTWVKNNARWWANGSIDDKDFVVGMQHLAQKNIIHVDKVYNQKVDSNQEIPEWIRNNARWWADGLISDSDFVNGIQYLAQQGIIRVN